MNAMSSSNGVVERGKNWVPSMMEETETETIARGGVACPFPWRLHEMLLTVEQEGNDHIVSWQPHGFAFKVHNPKEFVEEVLTRYVVYDARVEGIEPLVLMSFCCPPSNGTLIFDFAGSLVKGSVEHRRLFE